MQQRYYDPIAGRFLSVDPVVTDANTGKGFGLYTYVDNNPYAKIDPDGREPSRGDPSFIRYKDPLSYQNIDPFTGRDILAADSNGESRKPTASAPKPKPNGSSSTGNAYIDGFTSSLESIALSTIIHVGCGYGPVCGTLNHTEFGNRVKALGRDDVFVERSFDLSGLVEYGLAGSIRTDVILGKSPLQPVAIYDLKTGKARLTDARANQIRKHFPNFKGPIFAIYPQIPSEEARESGQ